MNKKLIIAVDVDLTVVDTLTPWLDWFYEMTGQTVKNECGSYDLVPEMKRLIQESGCVTPDFDPMSYWKRADLYDNLTPLPGAVRVIDEFIKAGHTVVFVSACISEHTDSKIRFLKKFFHESCRFISTVDKEFVAYDVLIDDRLSHMIAGTTHRPHAKHIMFTGVRADGTRTQRTFFTRIASWDIVLNYLFNKAGYAE